MPDVKRIPLQFTKLESGAMVVHFWPVGVCIDTDGDASVFGYGDRATNIFIYFPGDCVPDPKTAEHPQIYLGDVVDGDTWIVFYDLSPVGEPQ